MSDVDVAVIGAGVVGLACAATLASRGDSVLVLEQHARIGQETSSRNSGVIHAGFYYPTGSLKARLCVQGRALLYARAQRDQIDHRRIGKLLVATQPSEVAKLESLFTQGSHNGAGALRMLDAREVRALEPRVSAIAGLHSPETGIVDTHGLLNSYLVQARAHDTTVCLRTRVTAIEPEPSGYQLITETANEPPQAVRARRVVNAAGLHASNMAALAGLPVAQLGWVQRYCKGDYFSLSSRLRGVVSQLIYPVPVDAGLGIHITLDLAGALRAGPDTHYVDELAYDVRLAQRASFGAALRRYLPEVLDDDLTPDYAGIRPKLQGPGQPMADFVIEEASTHGLPGLVNLLGIESPGLTASEAIALRVAQLLPI